MVHVTSTLAYVYKKIAIYDLFYKDERNLKVGVIQHEAMEINNIKFLSLQ